MACDSDGSNWMCQVLPHSASATNLERVAACGCMVDRGDEDTQRRVVSIGSWDSARW